MHWVWPRCWQLRHGLPLASQCNTALTISGTEDGWPSRNASASYFQRTNSCDICRRAIASNILESNKQPDHLVPVWSFTFTPYTPLCGVMHFIFSLQTSLCFYVILECIAFYTLVSDIRGGQWPLEVDSYQVPCDWPITVAQLRWSEVTWQEGRSRSHGYSDDVVPAM
jgi:hypothetical protein